MTAPVRPGDDGFSEAEIEFDIADFLGDDDVLNWFLDAISRKAFGTPQATEIEYGITGLVDGTTVRMRVVGIVDPDAVDADGLFSEG